MKRTGAAFLGAIIIICGSARAFPASEGAGAESPPLIAPANPGGFFFCLGASSMTLVYDAASQRYLEEVGITPKRRLGIQAGIGYEIPLGQPLGQNLTLMAGVFLSSAGIRLTAASGEAEQVMSGLLVPLDFKLNFHGLFITAGPYFGFLTSAKRVFDDGSEDKITDINMFHYGISAGAGVELRLKSAALMIKVGTQVGLSNFVKKTSPEDTNRAEHNAITAVLAVRI